VSKRKSEALVDVYPEVEDQSEDLVDVHSEVEDQSQNASLSCTTCGKSYRTQKQVGIHFRDRHSLSGSITLDNGERICVKREEEKYSCHACQTAFLTLSGLNKHLLDRLNCLELAKLNSDILMGSVVSPDLPLTIPKKWRTYEEGIIHAEGVEESPESIKLKALLTSARLNIAPIGISIGGVETSVTVDQALYDVLPNQPFIIVAHKSQPTHSRNMENHGTPSTPEVATIVNKSRCAEVLRTRSYEELDGKMCEYLNMDWNRNPQAGNVAASIISGCIISNIFNGKAILVNEVEIYGRDEMLDCHQEHPRNEKGVIGKASTPSTTGEEFYKGVRPVTLRGRDGVRLVIGTCSCNALITSCVRIDEDVEGSISVGGDTVNFEILENELKFIRIFVDRERITEGEEMAQKTKQAACKDFGIEHLRQIRSKFDIENTFQLLRRSGPLTDRQQFRPQTIFTLAKLAARESGCSAASRIFYKVANAVLKDGRKAILELEDIEEVLHKHQSEKSVPVGKILELLSSDESSKIRIVGNEDLNDELVVLAKSLSSKISTVNQNTVTELRTLFFNKK
ncbi:hypothetical protein BGZ49_002953, partial [Haplosporangium sp. Z 27]